MLASLEYLVPVLAYVILFRRLHVEAARLFALRLVCDGLLGRDEVRLLDIRLSTLVEVCLIIRHL